MMFQTESYNLEDDLYENQNLARENPDIVRKMEILFEDARSEADGFPYGGRIQHKPAREMP